MEEIKNEVEKVEFEASEIEYVSYGGEHHLPLIMRLVDEELSEPYSIFTYRYFVYLWPQLCFLAFHGDRCVGTVVCKMGDHRNTFRGYIAMLVVIKPYRGRGIATELVTRSIEVMMESGCEEPGASIGNVLLRYQFEFLDGSENTFPAAIDVVPSFGLDCRFWTTIAIFCGSGYSPRSIAEAKVLKVTLEAEVTNKGALALYGRLGFIRAKRLFRYYLNGVDAFRLKLLFPHRPSMLANRERNEVQCSDDSSKQYQGLPFECC